MPKPSAKQAHKPELPVPAGCVHPSPPVAEPPAFSTHPKSVSQPRPSSEQSVTASQASPLSLQRLQMSPRQSCSSWVQSLPPPLPSTQRPLEQICSSSQRPPERHRPSAQVSSARASPVTQRRSPSMHSGSSPPSGSSPSGEGWSASPSGEAVSPSVDSSGIHSPFSQRSSSTQVRRNSHSPPVQMSSVRSSAHRRSPSVHVL